METLHNAEETLRKIQLYKKDLQYKASKIEQCEHEITLLARKKELISSAKEYHKKAIDILYKSSIKELEDLLNEVISAIFFDRNIQIKMELTDSRNKSLVWSVIDLDKDVQMSIKNGTGRGVRTVVSFVIQSYYLLSLGSKYMFIDEGYSFISEAYVGKFFEYVKMLCEQRGLALIMISHDDRFSGYADMCYGVLAGKIYNNKQKDYAAFKKWLDKKQQKMGLVMEDHESTLASIS